MHVSLVVLVRFSYYLCLVSHRDYLRVILPWSYTNALLTAQELNWQNKKTVEGCVILSIFDSIMQAKHS